MRRSTISILIIGALLIFTIYVPIPLGPLKIILIKIFETRLDADIKCRSLKIHTWRSITAKEVEAYGKGGFALSAESVVFDYNIASVLTGRLHITCNLEDVKFYRSSSIINSLTDMLHIKPLGNQTFNTVRADLFVGRRDTLTQNLTMLSDEMKIFGNAITDRDDNIMSLLYIHLKEKVADDIPNEIRDALLKKEDGPWSSLYIGIMGNYRTPMLRIITERFRMNISSK